MGNPFQLGQIWYTTKNSKKCTRKSKMEKRSWHFLPFQYMPILHMVPVLLPLIHISLTGRFVNDNQEEEENQNVNELWIMTLLHMSMRHLWWCKCLAVMAVAVDYDDFDIDDRASRDNVFEVSTRWWQWRLSDTQHSLTFWTRCL